MAEKRFPGAVEHKREHASFVATLAALRAQLEKQGPGGYLAIDVNNKVCNWLVRHVLGTDKALGTFLRARR